MAWRGTRTGCIETSQVAAAAAAAAAAAGGREWQSCHCAQITDLPTENLIFMPLYVHYIGSAASAEFLTGTGATSSQHFQQVIESI